MSKTDFSDYQDFGYYMKLAINEAKKALSKSDVPVGAIVVTSDGKVIAKSHNLRQSQRNPIMHAEVIAIQKACKKLKTWQLNNCSMFVTLEPCLMCAGALSQSRIGRVVFGAFDPKAGALGSLYNVAVDPRLNHEFEVVAFLDMPECSQLLKNFFRDRRLNSV